MPDSYIPPDIGSAPLDSQARLTHGPRGARSAAPEAGARVILGLAAVLFVALRAGMISVPFERDEGEYAYIAQRLTDGGVPYRDAFLQKTPGVVFVYAAAFAVGGERIEAVHAMLYVFSALTAVLLYRLIATTGGAVAGAMAALALCVTTIEPRLLASAANTEQFALLPLTAGALLAARARQRQSLAWSAASGLCCATAFWFKQVALAPALVAPLILLATHAPTPSGAHTARRLPRRAALLATWLIAAAALSALPVAYLLVNGVWGAFVDCAFSHNWAYARRLSPGDGIDALGAALRWQWPAMGGVWLLSGVGLLWRRRRPAPTSDAPSPLTPFLRRRELAAWLGLSFVATAAPMSFYQHYFIWLLPPLCGLAGLGAAGVWEAVRSRSAALRGRWKRQALRTCCGAGLVALAALPTLIANWPVWRAEGPRAISAMLYRQNIFWESIDIGRYIRDHTRPDDAVFILGSEPQILFYANRPSATRYTIMYPLFGPYSDAEARHREALAQIEQSRPRWILDVRLRNSLTPDINAPTLLLERVAAMLLPGQGYRLSALVVGRRQQQRFETLFGEEARRHADLYGLPDVGIFIYERP